MYLCLQCLIFPYDESPNSLNIHYTEACQTFWNNGITLQHWSHLHQYHCAKKCQTIPQFASVTFIFISCSLPRNMNPGNRLVLEGEIYDSLLQVWYWILDRKYSNLYSVLSSCHVVCLHSNELWWSVGTVLEVIYRHWYICPHYWSWLGTASEIIEKRLITVQREEDRENERFNFNCHFVLICSLNCGYLCVVWI